MNGNKVFGLSLLAGICFFSWGCHKDVIPEGSRVALTFDDGPDGKYTPEVLDILKREGIKATFFLMGKHIKRCPEVTLRIAGEGHCIGNHSYHHYWLPFMNSIQLLSEVSTTENLIDSLCGGSHKYFRAPWGAITAVQKEQLATRGFTVFNWDLDSDDWDIQHNTTDDIVRRVMANVGSGKIILFHSADFADLEGREKTVAALPQIIDLLKQKHFRFVTLDELVLEKQLQQ